MSGLPYLSGMALVLIIVACTPDTARIDKRADDAWAILIDHQGEIGRMDRLIEDLRERVKALEAKSVRP
jgi:hypothetical protein